MTGPYWAEPGPSRAEPGRSQAGVQPGRPGEPGGALPGQAELCHTPRVPSKWRRPGAGGGIKGEVILEIKSFPRLVRKGTATGREHVGGREAHGCVRAAFGKSSGVSQDWAEPGWAEPGRAGAERGQAVPGEPGPAELPPAEPSRAEPGSVVWGRTPSGPSPWRSRVPHGGSLILVLFHAR